MRLAWGYAVGAEMRGGRSKNSNKTLYSAALSAHLRRPLRNILVWLNGWQPIMLSIPNEELIDLVGPEFEDGRFDQQLFYFFFAFRVKGDPDALCFHAHDVLVDDIFIDQEINISAVGRNEVSEIILHLKLYGNLVLLHNSIKRQTGASKVAQQKNKIRSYYKDKLLNFTGPGMTGFLSKLTGR